MKDTMKNKQILPLTLVALYSASFSNANAATLVNETFSDGNRTTQNLSTSLDWHMLGGSAPYADSVADNTWTMNDDATYGSVGYFTAPGSPASLAVGEKMTLSFDLTYATNSTSAGSFRFALLDSGGERISADMTGMQDSAFESYTGYASFYALSSTNNLTSGNRIRQRNSGNDQLWTSGAFTILDTTTTAATAIDTVYSASLELDYISPSLMRITTVVNGDSFTYDDSTPLTSFDTISMYSNGTNGAIGISNMLVTVIPEPSATTALIGLLAITASITSRRRHHS